MRTETRGRRETKSIAIATVSPGWTGREGMTSATVRSSVLPSSGAMYLSEGSRSSPSAPVMRRISIEPQESGGSFPSRLSPRESFQNVESVLRKAFRYRWNWSVDAGFEVVFFQVRTCVPSTVFLSVSSRQVIWYEATGGGGNATVSDATAAGPDNAAAASAAARTPAFAEDIAATVA